MVEVLHYAFGGGLGHLTRTRSLRHTLGLDGSCATLCSSPLAKSHPIALPLHPVVADPALDRSPETLRTWILDRLREFQPKTIFVDTFPEGILGELRDFPWPAGTRRILVARLFDNSRLRSIPNANLEFDRVLVTEQLPPAQIEWLRRISPVVEPLELSDPPETVDAEQFDKIRQAWPESGRPVWLVVHSGPDAETSELARYAAECAHHEGIVPRLVVVSESFPADLDSAIERLRFSTPTALYPMVERIFTAGGFNAVRQTRPWAAKHRALPFPRRFDDQFLRVALARTATPTSLPDPSGTHPWCAAPGTAPTKTP